MTIGYCEDAEMAVGPLSDLPTAWELPGWRDPKDVDPIPLESQLALEQYGGAKLLELLKSAEATSDS